MSDFVDFPSIGEELVRKALTEIRRLCTDHANGVITARELRLCLISSMNSVDGLIKDEYADAYLKALSHAAANEPNDYKGTARVFKKGMAVATVSVDAQKQICIVMVSPDRVVKWEPQESSLRKSMDCIEHGGKICEKLTLSGFEEVL